MHQELTHKCTPLEIETSKKQCPICEQTFFAKKVLSHLKNCEKLAKEMTNGCPKCKKVFDIRGKHTRSTWQHHLKNCEKLFIENQKAILCELCGKSCAGKKANKDHMIEFHTGDFFHRILNMMNDKSAYYLCTVFNSFNFLCIRKFLP